MLGCFYVVVYDFLHCEWLEWLQRQIDCYTDRQTSTYRRANFPNIPKITGFPLRQRQETVKHKIAETSVNNTWCTLCIFNMSVCFIFEKKHWCINGGFHGFLCLAHRWFLRCGISLPSDLQVQVLQSNLSDRVCPVVKRDTPTAVSLSKPAI